MEEKDSRRVRAEARLAELGDEPGGAEFLARMGVLGDWIVDFAFGDVHTRPGLTARERELIIVAVLATLGSSDPQVQAHIRALRAINVPWAEIEETILQITPYAGVPRAVYVSTTVALGPVASGEGDEQTENRGKRTEKIQKLLK